MAVIDAVGEDRAHLIDYSMVGWLSAGVARFHPARLASVMIAGWDIQDGMYTTFKPFGIEKMEFGAFIEMAEATAPDLTEWLTEETRCVLEPWYGRYESP